MPRDTILFDINKTVLDLSSLKPRFKAALGSKSVTATWFSMLLHTSTVCALTATRTDFATLAGTMLDAIAARLGVELAEEARTGILSGFSNLPAHDDVEPALTRLRTAGYRTVAFTNSSLNLVTTQINNAGLAEQFSEIISVEATGSFKPDPKVYAFVAECMNRPIDDLRLVATHDWDTHGALSAGMRAAYIDRSGAPYHPLYRQPDVHATNMVDVAEQIISRDKA